MPRRTGSADLPLHGGRVPAWLAERMAALGRVICEAIVHHYGRDELLRRLSQPFWFQSFGAVMGMDWHSSGITTSVIGALKRGLAPVAPELGVHVCGGRGRQSRLTPRELLAVGERTGVNGDLLARSSRLVAKVDSAALQDGFELYLHAFVVTDAGSWCVVQQGMNAESRTARRYHWLSEGLQSFVDAPHAAIEGRNRGVIVNLTDVRAEPARSAQIELVQAGPDRVVSVLRRQHSGELSLFADPAALAEPELIAEPLPHLRMPARHDVRASDVSLSRLHSTLRAAAEVGPSDFAELLLTPGIGARTIASLAFVAEVVHGTPSRFSDPARFSLSLGGKDGHPFPVPLRVYDETIVVLKRAVEQAKLGREETLAALARLDAQARQLDREVSGPSFESHVASERAAAPARGGRTVFSTPRARAVAPDRKQLRLPGLARRRGG